MCKIVYVYADTPMEINCSLHNAIFPAKHINKTGIHEAKIFFIEDFRRNEEEVRKACEESDLIIVERNYFGDTLIMLTYWRMHNKNVAAIFDDAYDLMEPNNVSYPFWIKNEITARNEQTGEPVKLRIVPPVLDQFRYGLRQVKGIILPSKMLCQDWSKINKTYRTHNYIEPDRYANPHSLYPHDDILIGWCGSLSHWESFERSGIIPALQYILQKYDNVRLMIGGDPRVYNLFEVPEGKKMFFHSVPEEQYASLISTMDIGLAVLASDFDRRRSWIKVLEYMYLKIPWIASDFITYSELRDYGTLVKNGTETWKKGLEDMVLNIEQKRKLANTKAYDFALTQTWDKNIDKYMKLLQEIIDAPYVW